MLVLSDIATIIMNLFLIAAFGYLLGSIKVKGICLGTAAIFISGLVFGHMGINLPEYIQSIGLVLFITAVGMAAGPTFITLLKRNGLAYIILCVSIAIVGAIVCVLVIQFTGVDKAIAVGLMTGAYTTSPGFAAAKEAVSGGTSTVEMVAAGYGIAYPIGVIGKVLYTQLMPQLCHADMAVERGKIRVIPSETAELTASNYKKIDPLGFFSMSLAIVTGILLGSIVIPFAESGNFSLGLTGGPLVAGLLFGQLQHIGKWELNLNTNAIKIIKEIGLLLFFSCAGAEGGKRFVSVLETYGVKVFLCALILLLIPLIAGTFIALKILKLPLLNGLASIAASMTSTPSLAILTNVAGTDEVASAYATTYPFALITLVIAVRIILILT